MEHIDGVVTILIKPLCVVHVAARHFIEDFGYAICVPNTISNLIITGRVRRLLFVE